MHDVQQGVLENAQRQDQQHPPVVRQQLPQPGQHRDARPAGQQVAQGGQAGDRLEIPQPEVHPGESRLHLRPILLQQPCQGGGFGRGRGEKGGGLHGGE